MKSNLVRIPVVLYSISSSRRFTSPIVKTFETFFCPLWLWMMEPVQIRLVNVAKCSSKFGLSVVPVGLVVLLGSEYWT